VEAVKSHFKASERITLQGIREDKNQNASIKILEETASTTKEEIASIMGAQEDRRRPLEPRWTLTPRGICYDPITCINVIFVFIPHILKLEGVGSHKAIYTRPSLL